MRTFFFNTGVKIWVNSSISGGIDSGNGTVVIPFDCEDVPENATFKYACDNKTNKAMKEYFLKVENIKTNEVKTKRTLLPIKDGLSCIAQIGKIRNDIKLIDCYEIK